MIDSKELRIGNWVYASSSILIHHNRPEMVHEIVEGGVNNMAPFYYNPIPLTPEILEKCGFEWDSNDVAFHKSEEFYLKQTDVSECMLIVHDGTRIGIFIKSLHQLQNLFFALTGKELTVNL